MSKDYEIDLVINAPDAEGSTVTIIKSGERQLDELTYAIEQAWRDVLTAVEEVVIPDTLENSDDHVIRQSLLL